MCTVLLLAAVFLSQPHEQAAPASQLVRMVIHIQDAAGQEITTERYVAAAAAGASWAQPAAERLSPAGDPPPVITVPPGTYRVACAAEGFSPRWVEGVVAEGEKATATCALQHLVVLPGIVVSAKDRRPIAGARLGSARVLAGGDAYRVSALAEPLIVSQLAATTDKDGKFSLRAGAVGNFPLWVEADGFQPLYLPGTSTTSPLPPLALQPGGGSLTVKLDISGGAYEGCRLDLVAPVRLRGPHPALPPYLLHREVPRDGMVMWGRLPDGVYRLRLVSPAIQSESSEIAHVFVGGGRATTLKRAVATPPPTAIATVSGLSVVVADPPDPPSELGLKLWQPGTIKALKPQWGTTHAGVEFLLKEACELPCFLLASDATGRVGGVDLSQPRGRQPVSLVLFPAGIVAGKLTVPADTRRPTWARFAPEWCDAKPQEEIERLGSYPFAIKDDGSWEVSVPVGCLRLLVIADGFVTAKVGRVEVTAGGRTSIGTLELHPGGEIQARLVEGGGAAIANATVDALPESEAKNVARTTMGIPGETRQPASHSGAKGWVILKGVPVGQVLLRVMRSGHIPLLSQPIEVRAGQTAVLDPLELEPPASLAVLVKGQSTGDIGSLRVLVSGGDEGPYAHSVSSAALGKDGTASFAEVPAGRWQVEVWSKGELGGGSVAHSSVTLIPGGHDEVVLEVIANTFKGTVTRRDQPVGGIVEFRPTRPGVDMGEVARARADEEGRFSVLLTEPGRYTVQVRSGSALWHAGPVLFEDPDQDVEICIPPGVVSGTVVDRDGKSVEKASVAAYQPRDTRDGTPEWPITRSAVSGSDGTFTLDDLGPGCWSLAATKGEDNSDPVRLTIQGDEEINDLRLVLQSDTVVGYVLDAAGGGVSGSGWCIVPAASPLEAPLIGQHRFDADETGAFQLHFTPEERQVWLGSGLGCMFCAPGKPVAAVRHNGTGVIEIRVPPVGGHVTLRAPAELRRATNLLSLILVGPNGVFVHLRLLAHVVLLGNSLDSVPKDKPVILPLGWFPVGSWRVVLPRTVGELDAVVRGVGYALPPLGQVDVIGGGAVDLVLHALQ